ncbi:retrovirus-related pol polyprotein from transposon TNT 1-94 [Tanacetum coccineum]
MIPHRSWFTTYESFNGGNVYMGNGSICLVIGKGNIQVKMHDGVVRTITGVRHVPDLNRNLISFSILEANGCKYSGEAGVMKIFKGALVLMKAIQSGGLYVLQGTVVYGTAGVATSKASLDDSKLWHYRLGHMGEKGKKIKKLRTNNGLEFYGESFNALCRKSLDGNIQEILWSSNSVDYSNLRVFRCPIYVHVNEEKLVPRAVKFIFLGYGSGVKGYRVWCPDPGNDFVTPHNVDNNHIEGKVEFEFDVENSTHTQPPFNDENI